MPSLRLIRNGDVYVDETENFINTINWKFMYTSMQENDINIHTLQETERQKMINNLCHTDCRHTTLSGCWGQESQDCQINNKCQSSDNCYKASTIESRCTNKHLIDAQIEESRRKSIINSKIYTNNNCSFETLQNYCKLNSNCEDSTHNNNCCHRLCAAGCVKPNSPNHCYSCSHVLHNGECIDRCMKSEFDPITRNEIPLSQEQQTVQWSMHSYFSISYLLLNDFSGI